MEGQLTIDEFWQLWEAKGKLVLWSFAAGLLVCYVIVHIPAAVSFHRAQGPMRQAAGDAASLGLTYEDVLKNPQAAIGKPVKWMVGHPSRNFWYYRGNPSTPIAWEGGVPEVSETGQSGAPNAVEIVGIVAAVAPDRITLRTP